MARCSLLILLGLVAIVSCANSSSSNPNTFESVVAEVSTMSPMGPQFPQNLQPVLVINIKNSSDEEITLKKFDFAVFQTNAQARIPLIILRTEVTPIGQITSSSLPYFEITVTHKILPRSAVVVNLALDSSNLRAGLKEGEPSCLDANLLSLSYVVGRGVTVVTSRTVNGHRLTY